MNVFANLDNQKTLVFAGLLFSVVTTNALVSLAQAPNMAGDVSLIHDVRGLPGEVRDIAFCPNGTMLAACSQKEVRVWDARTGRALRTLRGQIGANGDGDCLSLAFSHDNCELVVGIQSKGGTGAIRVYDIRRIAEIDQVIDGFATPVTDVAFSQNGRFLAAACADGSLTIYDWSVRRVVGQVNAGTLPDGARKVFGFPIQFPVLFTRASDSDAALTIPGCTILIQQGQRPPSLTRWRAELPDASEAFGREMEPCDLRLNYGFWLAYGQDDGAGNKAPWVGRWSVGKANPDTIYKGHSQTVSTATFNGDCSLIASGDRVGAVHVWDANTGQRIFAFQGIAQPIFRAAMDAKSRRVGFTTRAAPPGQLGWNFYGEIDQQFEFDTRAIRAATPDQFLAGERTSRDGQLSVIHDGEKYGFQFQWPGGGWWQFFLGESPQPTCYSLLQSARHGLDFPALIGDKAGGISLYDPEKGDRHKRYNGHQSYVTSLCEAADGRCFTSSSRDGTIRWWNLSDKKQAVTPSLSLFLGIGGQWIAWTSEGFYDAAPGCGDLVGWHVNRGWSRSASFYPLHQFRDQLYRPDIVHDVFRTGNSQSAITQAAGPRIDPAQPISGDAPLAIPSPVPVTTDFRNPATMQQMQPPRIRIVSPRDGAVVRKNKIHLLAEIVADNDLPIQSIRLLVNGRPVLDKGIAVVGEGEDDQRRLSFSRVVPLTPGDNEVSLLAENGVAHSTPASVQVRFEAPASFVPAKPNLHMLAIGISDYKNPAFNLRYAHLDAEAFASAWENQRGVVYENLSTEVLTNGGATGKHMRVAMKTLADNVQRTDVAVIFLSGHGIRDRKLEYYLAPHEVDPENLAKTGLHFSVVTDLVESLPCKVLLFVDTCHAAGITGAKSLWRDPLYELTSAEYGAIVFASSLSNEISVEDEEWGHGAFTKAILSTFADPQADLNGDRFLSLTEFEQSVGDRVARLTKGQQHPVMKRPATIRNIPFYRLAQPTP